MSDKITGIRCSHYVPNAHAVCSNMHAILHLLDCLTTLHLEGKPASLVWNQRCWSEKVEKCEGGTRVARGCWNQSESEGYSLKHRPRE